MCSANAMAMVFLIRLNDIPITVSLVFLKSFGLHRGLLYRFRRLFGPLLSEERLVNTVESDSSRYNKHR